MSPLLKTFLVGALLASGPLASAAAQPPASVVVRLADLDPESEQDARVLLRRIERAAAEVCGESVARQYHSTWPTYEACRRAMIADTVARFNSRELRERHARRFGGLTAEAANR